MRLPVLLAAGALTACANVAIGMDNLSCSDGECLPGYVCDDATNLCIPEATAGDTGGQQGGDHAGQGDPLAGDPTAGDPLPGDPLPGDPLPGDPVVGDPLPGDPLPGDPLPGDPLPGDPGPTISTHISRVQHGTTILPSGESSVDATGLESMTVSHSVLFFNVAENANTPSNGQISGQIASDTSLTFERVGTGGDVRIAWHVAEFSSGVSVQRGRTVKTSDTPNTVDVGLASSVDLASTFVMATSAFAGGGFGANDWHRFYLSDASTLVIDAPGAGSDQGLRVNWQVVEAAGVSTQCGSATLGGTSTTVTISPVQYTESFLVFSHSAADETMDKLLVQGRLATTSQAAFERRTNGSDLAISYCVVEWPGASVQHGLEIFAMGETQLTGSLNAAVDLTRAVVFLPGYMREGTTNYTADDIPGTGWFTTTFADDSSVTIRRDSSSSTANAAWTVVEFPE